MMDKNLYKYLLATDGVNQLERSPLALDPAQVKVDSRSQQDMLRFLWQFSTQLQYYDLHNLPQGNWRAFLEALSTGSDMLDDDALDTLYATTQDAPPHLALLLAFLKMYGYLQQDLNKLPTKRLNFYYETVLGIQRRTATSDQLHVLFELTKNAAATRIAAGTLLDAGKTATGLPLQYTLDSELILNHTLLDGLYATYLDTTPGGKLIAFKTEDATAVVNESATAWRPLGAAQYSQPIETRAMQAVSFGWAVASPTLLMAEGHRIVKLTLQLRARTGFTSAGLVLTNMLDIRITSEKEWLTPDQILKAELTPGVPLPLQDPTAENSFTLALWVAFTESTPAITAYAEDIHEGHYATPWPVLQVQCKPTSYLIETFSNFYVETVTTAVAVTGVKNLILQNDQAPQPADKPILPFGNTPIIGANFYIGSQEIFSKTLTSLDTHLTWQDLPDDFFTLYAPYGNHNVTPGAFQVEMELLSARNWNIQLMTRTELFNTSNLQLPRTLHVSPATFDLQTSNSPYTRKPTLTLPKSYQGNLPQGFVRMVLSHPTRGDLSNQPAQVPLEAFGHKTYPFVYTRQAIALGKHTTGPEPVLPQPPYTPTLKSITLDYTAEDTFRPDAPNHIDQYFMLDAFGPVASQKDAVQLLIPETTEKGSLYIGLANTTPPQLISLLFQLEEGSVPGETLLQSTDLTWSYLAGTRWQRLAAADVLEDSTQGLQKSGIIRLNLGPDATLTHTRMPAGKHWLRLSVDANPEGAAAITGLFTQAARATLVLNETNALAYESHLAHPLPAESVTRLSVKLPTVKKVMQPYPSFGGRASETNAAFYQRVSERLRHKARASAAWDYRRIVLEAFPQIYKVKCLPHASPEDVTLTYPGNVWLVVIPDWRKYPTGTPLQPNVNRSLLREIENFISARYTSAFTTLHVTNPTYETLLVDCKVSFHAGFDAGYYSTLLNEEIKKFLSPWAYPEGKDIVFGGKIHASEILAFIEGRAYVDYVVDFALYHRHGGHLWHGIGEMEINLDFIIGYSPAPTIGSSSTGEGGKTINLDFVVGEPVEVAEATRPDTILVSNNYHRIEAVPADAAPCVGTQQIGIGQMIVGLDFVPIS